MNFLITPMQYHFVLMGNPKYWVGLGATYFLYKEQNTHAQTHTHTHTHPPGVIRTHTLHQVESFFWLETLLPIG